jgi:alpha-tubulin suppressor-like RCC1 family protein
LEVLWCGCEGINRQKNICYFFAISPQGTEVMVVAAGAEHTAAITASGKLYGWGWGRYGNLGLGDRDDRSVPVEVVTLNVCITNLQVHTYITNTGFALLPTTLNYMIESLSSKRWVAILIFLFLYYIVGRRKITEV